ncbi:MAG: outer rane efflux protein [Myxococcales bacterium]|nr:outer rane efflux protein [Myxococcales bacterium]
MLSFVYFQSAGSIIVALAIVAAPAPAQALQPLAEFLAGARTASVDNREAAMTAVEQQEEALVALGRELPDVLVRGTYTRNQFAAVFPVQAQPGGPTMNLTIQPYDQWDLFLQADAPLIDFAGWARARATHRAAKAARYNVRATALEVQKQVARQYYTLIGADALRGSAQRTLAAAQSNAELTRERRAGGVATALDVERAQAEVERARQNIADAELQSELARRALTTLTGVTASAEIGGSEDDLHAEAPLEKWEATPEATIPTLAAAAEQARSAATNARAARLSLIPTLTATFVERVTNATSFTGQPNYFTFTLNANWRLDLTTIASIRVQSALAQISRIREQRTRLAVRDQIYEAWQRTRTGIIKSQAARAQARAADLAAQFATERYTNGAGTQLDVVQAQRDAFAAQVGRVQADADLAFARTLLRLTAGVSIDQDQR